MIRTRAAVTFWDLINLYVTGAFLVIFMLAHVVLMHYVVSSPLGVRFDSISARLHAPLYQVLDVGLLALALYHGLAGVRRFVAHLEVVGASGLRIVTAALLVAGLVALYCGWLVFTAFLR